MGAGYLSGQERVESPDCSFDAFRLILLSILHINKKDMCLPRTSNRVSHTASALQGAQQNHRGGPSCSACTEICAQLAALE